VPLASVVLLYLAVGASSISREELKRLLQMPLLYAIKILIKILVAEGWRQLAQVLILVAYVVRQVRVPDHHPRWARDV